MYNLCQDRVASLTAELAASEDGREKGRIRRRLSEAEQTAAIMHMQLSQQGDMERELWVLLWSTPQATMWDESAAFARVLAQFVRWNVRGEQGDLDAAREARIRGREFGLTPLTLLGLKAEVEKVEAAEAAGARRRATPAASAKKKGEGGDDPRSGLFIA